MKQDDTLELLCKSVREDRELRMPGKQWAELQCRRMRNKLIYEADRAFKFPGFMEMMTGEFRVLPKEEVGTRRCAAKKYLA